MSGSYIIQENVKKQTTIRHEEKTSSGRIILQHMNSFMSEK